MGKLKGITRLNTINPVLDSFIQLGGSRITLNKVYEYRHYQNTIQLSGVKEDTKLDIIKQKAQALIRSIQSSPSFDYSGNRLDLSNFFSKYNVCVAFCSEYSSLKDFSYRSVRSDNIAIADPKVYAVVFVVLKNIL